MCWYSDVNFHSFNNIKSGMVKSEEGVWFCPMSLKNKDCKNNIKRGSGNED